MKTIGVYTAMDADQPVNLVTLVAGVGSIPTTPTTLRLLPRPLR